MSPLNSSFAVFDPQANGHHPEFLRHLAVGAPLDREVTFFVHPSLVGMLRSILLRPNTVQAIPPNLAGIGDHLPKASVALAQIRWLRERISSNSTIFFPRINGYLSALAETDLRAAKLRIEGILFAPSIAAWTHGGSLRDKSAAFGEWMRLLRVRKKTNLHRLFLLNDPTTAGRLNQLLRLPGGVYTLSDPIPQLPEPPLGRISEIRDRLNNGNPAPPFVFLLIGALRNRKGVIETVSAFQSWTPSSDREVCLLLVGSVQSEMLSTLNRQLEVSCASRQVRIVTELGRIPDEDFAAYLSLADCLLLPYTRPLGSSGILGHAARIGKPVLANKDGLLGHLVRFYELGYTFDSQNLSCWAKNLDFAMSDKETRLSNRANLYNEVNSVNSFREAIFSDKQ